MTVINKMWSRERLLLNPSSRRISRIRRYRLCGLQKSLILFVAFTIVTLFCLSQYLFRDPDFRSISRPIPVPSFRCHDKNQRTGHLPLFAPHNHQSHQFTSNVHVDSKVLLFVETQYSPLGRQIAEVLEASRIKFKVEISGKSLPVLTNMEKGKFAVVIFENMDKYIQMNKWNRELLDKYCLEFSVGVIGFMSQPKGNDEVEHGRRMKGFPISFDSHQRIGKYILNPRSPVLRISKSGQITDPTMLSNTHWTLFRSNHATYFPVAEAVTLHDGIYNESLADSENLDNVSSLASGDRMMAIVQDTGKLDGINRIIFGCGFQLWINKMILLDSISFLSRGRLALPVLSGSGSGLKRFLLIDIDDIFVGEQGTRMKAPDVEALLVAQRKFSSLVPGFKFNLGFSGKYYHKGTPEEDEGDDMLIDRANEFWWFCHLFSHSQPHVYNNTVLESEMKLNKEFAQAHKIPANSGYSIAPHHSGVYPVHEPLFEFWKSVWDVRVTSTEEYPHLRPARLRRGFIHRGIMVLPRQTCGLYTHTIFYDKYPGGGHKLDASIMGGELFYTFVFNPINVFMTHLSNYGNDRLALYTFESAIRFLQCWTNLQLVTLPPQQLAVKYFQMHPEESDPVWVNPCLDKRHRAIWSANKSCDQLPKFLVIGPQKTGSTALYTFLSMHPAIASSFPSPETFEEVQFFNGKNYYKGLDWYMNFFPQPGNMSRQYLFEKSATYFDGENVPLRVHALLPSVRLVTILISPIRRAYSWYQHMRAHGDGAALNHSFLQIVSADDNAPKGVRDLRNRCLNPGMYAQHLEHWLAYFPPQQMLIVDGEELKSDPVSVMDRLQAFLKIEPHYDYRSRLRFDPQKGFFCPVIAGSLTRTKCLGRGKGRAYPQISDEAEKYLRDFYTNHNIALSKLLTKLHQPIPLWLEQDLTHI